MEIERKFLIKQLPENLAQYKSLLIEQGYLSVEPVIRIRRQNEQFILTYKGAGLMSREEYNLPLTRDSYYHLKEKIDGNLISKRRYLIPLKGNLTIELDVFHAPFSSLKIAEVEFPDEETAKAFTPPDWFGEDVTFDGKYHNSYLSQMAVSHREAL